MLRVFCNAQGQYFYLSKARILVETSKSFFEIQIIGVQPEKGYGRKEGDKYKVAATVFSGQHENSSRQCNTPPLQQEGITVHSIYNSLNQIQVKEIGIPQEQVLIVM